MSKMSEKEFIEARELLSKVGTPQSHNTEEKEEIEEIEEISKTKPSVPPSIENLDETIPLRQVIKDVMDNGKFSYLFDILKVRFNHNKVGLFGKPSMAIGDPNLYGKGGVI